MRTPHPPSRRSRRCAVLTAVSFCLAAAPVAAQQQIGAVGAVNPRTTGQPPTAPAPRQLAIAEPLVLEERIVAGADGAAQVMFLDQTTLTIGPNSDVVIDRYFYDPDADAGDIALSVARGALRFVGGRISKGSDAQINVGGAVVALRGGIADVRTTDEGAEVTLLAGEFARVTTADRTVTISRPGGRLLIGADSGGLAPSLTYAGVIDAAAAGNLLASTRTAGGGGIRVPVDQAQAALDQAAGSLDAGIVSAAAISTAGEAFDLNVFANELTTAFTAVGLDITEVSAVATAAAVDNNLGGLIGTATVFDAFTLQLTNFSGTTVPITIAEFDSMGFVDSVTDVLDPGFPLFETIIADPGVGALAFTPLETVTEGVAGLDIISGAVPGSDTSFQIPLQEGVTSTVGFTVIGGPTTGP